MTALSASHVFAGLPVCDYAASREFYERLMGRPPDVLPHDREAVWQLADGGLVYIVDDPPHAGRSVVTLIVADLDRELAGLSERGIERPPVEAIGTVGRKATIVDPDGNRLALAQVS